MGLSSSARVISGSRNHSVAFTIRSFETVTGSRSFEVLFSRRPSRYDESTVADHYDFHDCLHSSTEAFQVSARESLLRLRRARW
jgi:hypothetical protein